MTTIVKVPCGYRVTRASVEYTDADRAWFRHPLREG